MLSSIEAPADDDLITFVGEVPPDPPAMAAEPAEWRILAVDDDQAFQRTLGLALRDAELLGRRVRVTQAYSMREAARILARQPEFAVVLVDVVMETDHAGLELIRAMRELLGRGETRVILLTGEPGMAPVSQVMRDFDISDYCLKSDLAARGLKNILTGVLRNYDQLQTISAARRGLQLIIESSSRLAGSRTLGEYSSAILAEIGRLLKAPSDGLICARPIANGGGGAPAGPGGVLIVGAVGHFRALAGRSLDTVHDREIRTRVVEALDARTSRPHPAAQVIFFPRESAGTDYAAYIPTGRPLNTTETELLRAFAANVAKDLRNVALIGELDRVAYQDESLPIGNKNHLRRAIVEALAAGERESHVLVTVDLDNFGGLNNAFGSEFGDHILEAVADRLGADFPPPATVSRIHSDYFAVLGRAGEVDADRAQAIFDRPFEIAGDAYPITACVSTLTLPSDDLREAAAVMGAARVGMRQAKLLGPNTVLAYQPAFDRRAAERAQLLLRLRAGLMANELFLLYQPQVDLASGRIIGAEALLRWNSADGPVSPAEFIPLAEQSAHIHAIGHFVVEQACAALRRLATCGLGELGVSVNVSARQFERPDLIGELVRMLGAAGVSTRRLGIEVTETAAMQDFERVSRQLAEYRQCGGFVAIDDFGTGMSSLEYLLELPADHLKLDITFVAQLEHDERCRSIARMIVDLGRRLGLQVVAEGVETAWQADWLRDNGCHVAQGWLFGRPMALDALIPLAASPPADDRS